MTEDEMVRWHHWLNGCEFEQALQDGKGQGSLACYSPWGGKESDMTEQLNTGGQTEEARRSTVPQWLKEKTYYRVNHDEKVKSYVPDEGTR